MTIYLTIYWAKMTSVLSKQYINLKNYQSALGTMYYQPLLLLVHYTLCIYVLVLVIIGIILAYIASTITYYYTSITMIQHTACLILVVIVIIVITSNSNDSAII